MDLTRRSPARKRPPRSSKERAAEIGRNRAYRERQEIIAKRAAFAVATKPRDICWQNVPMIREGGCLNLPFRVLPETAFAIGDRIYHRKFGRGTVTFIDCHKLTIQFDRAGEKRIVDSFVEREP
jgi:hypothetical protein